MGPGGVRREYERYALPEAIKKRTSHVHSTPLQILVERGALGLAAWLWIWAAFIAKSIGLLRRLPADSARERALVVAAWPRSSDSWSPASPSTTTHWRS